MAHFYLNEDLTDLSVGATAQLTGGEARHAVTVSRLQLGERVEIGNGAGLRVVGPITRAEPARLEIEIEELRVDSPPTPAIWLAQALAKGDRDELAVQAATELGVDGVIPWSAQRSISRWEGAKVAKGHTRWEAVVREATKQSIRSFVPEVGELVSSKQLGALAATTRMLVLDPTGDTALTELELDGRDVVLVVGPEGGIAPAELALLGSAGATVVRLGDTVLRTSTAGPAAIAVLNAKLGRW
ncbi:16S rRNA (uracil1498-N3)-methyltransferase [Glaciihabitans tibetensis]|uniref:Ribosomal RNA small subunit methyltransferase E n=1 Tax=Glaciihabitans tibetensis TaxID=1266600 RepID=A0A2T0VJ22_9MICO|nr:16S rRNA (uracil(1498)-N(3))-methyltransferase [Glaciihabitans tibetensis]PRY70222.1 16S rRNA (uracil1498-N3)-methyltransferase [Glaciihabitans tibetensis]